MTERTATISRKTNETQIDVFVNLDWTSGLGQLQKIDVSTGIGFLDHARSISFIFRMRGQLIRFPDVSCTGKAQWIVLDHEVSRRSVDR